MTIKEKIIKIRTSRGLNQTKFAKLIGVSHTAISNIEIGLRQPSLSLIHKISSVFNVDIETLLDDKADIKNSINNCWQRVDNIPPIVGSDVLVFLDYAHFKPGLKRIAIAHVHFTDEPVEYGGPNSLTGSGTLTGLYFSLPAIIRPGIVTHWMPLPKFPNN